MITAETLEAEFGKMITAKELSRYLGVDPRTLNKYPELWGGVEVFPGTYRFSYDVVKARLENARIDNEERQEAVARKRNLRQQNIPEAVSGCNKKIRASGASVGAGKIRRTQTKPDPHGLFESS